MHPAPQTLLDSHGLVDLAACNALAVQRSAWAIDLSRYPDILRGNIDLATEEARQEKLRRTATPDQIRLAALHRELIDGVFTCDYRDLDATRLSIADHQAEREALRERIETASAKAREDAQTPALVVAAEIVRAA